MSISYVARNRTQSIQEAIDNLFIEFGATVENRDWATEQTQQSEEPCVFQVLRDYENGAIPNGRVILAHDDILIDLQVYQTWRSNPSEHLPRKPLCEVVEVSKDENRTCSICYELVSPHLEVIILPCGHWFEWCCIQSWFERSFTCPMCRANVLEGSISPDDLWIMYEVAES
ncbi:uncharacterized protein N7503_009267 [Penicillium pulvis]|uniref:uncharacterized protein n=1 Tax=Penicillium pulvis TaxID=1562058 RepID=UPI002548DE9E|nr:uncharacterized protein N7503_009267 [Penicillium pulvis]KAJ5793289.1 hypothetical protein N7503_009267 [Penicillium pulvis]